MAGGYSTPGVYRREIDLSDILISTGISNGGTVVRAKKGPVRRPVLVTNDKEYIETFGKPYYVSGLSDMTHSSIGGHLVPELGYGSYGALEFLKESSTLYVFRAYDKDDKYSAVEFNQNDAEGCTSCVTSSGITVSDSPLEVFDTSERISTYEEYYRDGNIQGALLVGYVGPGEDGDTYAVTIETINPEAEWLYSYDEYPVETSATQAKYGYDVPEVWISDTVSTYVTSGLDTVDIINPSTSAVIETIDFIPVNASTYDESTNTWEVYSALSGSDAIPVKPKPDANIVWDYGVDVAGWYVKGKWTNPNNSLETGIIDTSGTYVPESIMSGGPEEVKRHFRIASDVVKVSVYKRPDNKKWEELYSNKDDSNDNKLRIEPLEVFYGTMKPELDNDGNELFIERTINGNSKFIYVKANKLFGSSDSASSASWDYSSGFLDVSLKTPDGNDNSGYYVTNGPRLGKLSGGSASMSPGFFGTDTEFWGYFTNREELPVQILINSSFSKEDKLAVADVCNIRRDCIAANQVGDVTLLDYRDIINEEEYGYPYPSFMALYAGYSRVYDKYNDKYVYLPNAIFGASLYARVDRIAEPWFAPSGVARGTVSVLDQNKIFSFDHIGKLYDKNINSIRNVPACTIEEIFIRQNKCP